MRDFCKKIRKIENTVVDFCVQRYWILFAIIATILALTLRYSFLRFRSIDFEDFLLPWFNALKEGGGLSAIANYSGDYNAPYVTILALLTYIPINPLISIKLVSIFFDLVLAIATAYLTYTISKNQKRKTRNFLTFITYIVTLFLPQVFLNSACWGQCDSIYASFCILALTFLIKEKYLPSFICLGVAFAFKLQFIFILPIFLVIYVVKRKFSIFNFLIIPLVDLILCLPAILAGCSIIDCFLVYFRQTQTYSYLTTLNFINIYQIFNGDSIYWNLAGLILGLVFCALALGMILHYKIKLTTQKILELTIWFTIILTFVLPSMHERYLFVGEILAVIYYIVYRKHGIIVLLINTYAWITYSYFLLPNTNFNYHILALVEVFVLAKFTKDVFCDTKPLQKPFSLPKKAS